MKSLLKRLLSVKELFSRVIILFCIGYMVRVVERCMDITEKSGASTCAIIEYAAMFFGGELTLLLAKRVTQSVGDAKTERTRISAGSGVDAE